MTCNNAQDSVQIKILRDSEQPVFEDSESFFKTSRVEARDNKFVLENLTLVFLILSGH